MLRFARNLNLAGIVPIDGAAHSGWTISETIPVDLCGPKKIYVAAGCWFHEFRIYCTQPD